MRRDQQGALGGSELLETAAFWAMMIGLIAVFGITAYYIYGTVAAGNALFRGIAANGQPITAADFQRNLANIELLTKVLLLGAGIGSLAALARYFRNPETGVGLVLVGVILFLGMPFLMDNMGGTGAIARPLARLGDPKAFLSQRFQMAGLMPAAAGMLQLVFHGIAYVSTARSRRPKPSDENAKTAAAVRKPNDKFLGLCWDLPFCRDTEKKLCPIRATKRPCWRTGRGCYCDQNVILTLSGGNTYQASRGASGYLSRSAATISRPKSLREKREQCLQCPVYLHHQGQKYQLLAPLSLIAIVGAVVYYWNTIRTLFPDFMMAVGRSLSTFSFSGGGQTSQVPGWAMDVATNPYLMWTVIIVALVMIIAYTLHALEWILYRLGI